MTSPIYLLLTEEIAVDKEVLDLWMQPSDWEKFPAEANDRQTRIRRASRAMVRRLRGALEPETTLCEIIEDENGKPMFDDGNFPFSLSHSHGRIAIAMRESGVLGIDIENPQRERDWVALSERWFAETESDAVKNHDNPGEAFCEQWVVREAIVKALGTGMQDLPKILVEDERINTEAMMSGALRRYVWEGWPVALAIPDIVPDELPPVRWERLTKRDTLDPVEQDTLEIV